MVRELADMSARPRRVTDNLYKGLAPARALAGWIDRARNARAAAITTRWKVGCSSSARDLRRDLKKGSGAYGEVSRARIWWRGATICCAGSRISGAAPMPISRRLLREEMRGVIDEYDQRKQRAGKLDFVDLLIHVRDLMRDQPDVRGYLQNRFTHLFIDEFQDTDPLQAEILLLLAADDPAESDWLKARPKAGKLFLVGDPKQSIYKFRRADMVLYRQVRERFAGRGVGLRAG